MRDNLAFNRRLIAVTVIGVFALALLGRWAVTLLGGPVDADAPADAGRGEPPAVERVVIISIDGLRPDLLLRARTPYLRSLMDNGSYSMWARTTEVSITLPSHVSMVTGVRPEFHGIHWNGYIEAVYPDVQTLFELAIERGLSTAIAACKSKFHELARPGSVDWMEAYKDKTGGNLDVGRSAADIIRRHEPDVMLVHLPEVDVVGHARGWGTPLQMEAIERADAAVGMVLSALADKGFAPHTAVIVTSDHGGAGTGHGANDPRSRHIPWIISGPGIRRNHDLARYGKLVINTEDTFATACTLLDLPLPYSIDGKCVDEIFERDELLQVAATTTPKPAPAKKATRPDQPGKPPSYRWQREEIPSHHR